MKRLSICTLILALGGCAFTTAVPVTDPDQEGFRFNGISTKFIATSNGYQALTYADPCKEYAVSFDAYLAQNHSNLKLTESGTLQEVDANLDTTAIPLKLVEVAGGVAKEAISTFGATSGVRGGGVTDRVIVYDIDCLPDGGSRLAIGQLIELPARGAAAGGVIDLAPDLPKKAGEDGAQ